jgi:uncharacterized membrane protein
MLPHNAETSSQARSRQRPMKSAVVVWVIALGIGIAVGVQTESVPGAILVTVMVAFFLGAFRNRDLRDDIPPSRRL